MDFPRAVAERCRSVRDVALEEGSSARTSATCMRGTLETRHLFGGGAQGRLGRMILATMAMATTATTTQSMPSLPSVSVTLRR